MTTKCNTCSYMGSYTAVVGGEWYQEHYWGFSWLNGKEPACQCRRQVFDPWSGKIPHAVVHQLILLTFMRHKY